VQVRAGRPWVLPIRSEGPIGCSDRPLEGGAGAKLAPPIHGAGICAGFSGPMETRVCDDGFFS
jgi:hypothetical protein